MHDSSTKEFVLGAFQPAKTLGHCQYLGLDNRGRSRHRGLGQELTEQQ